MPGNGRVFISHAYEDSARCQPLLAALDAWGVDYWFDVQRLDAGQHIAERVQQGLAERDILLLICTAATNVSMWTGLELQAFRGLMERDRQAGRAGRRKVVYLILDPHYARQPVGPNEQLIDATGQPHMWLKELREALGVRPPARGLSRRAVLGAGATAAVAVAAAGVAATGLLATRRGGPTPVIPTVHMPTSTPQPAAARLKWIYTTGANATVAASGDLVYLLPFSGMYALSPDKGDLRWYTGKLTAASDSLPHVANGVMYLNSDDNHVVAIHAGDGSLIWSSAASFPGSSTPLLDTGILYVHSNDGSIYALKASDGSLLWKTPIEASSYSTISSPASSATRAYVGGVHGNVFALDKTTGAIMWTYQTAGAITSSPAVAGGLVYIGSADHNVYALDIFTGLPRWKFQAGYEVNGSPMVVDNVVYIGASDGYLYALDATTGKVNWQAGAGDLDDSGKLKGGFGDPINSTPVVQHGMVYFVGGAYFYAVNATDGKRLWRYGTTEYTLRSPFAVSGGMAFILDDDTAYALQLS